MQGYVFVDRDGKHFRHILNWLRDGVVPTLEESEYTELLREAEYYQLLVSSALLMDYDDCNQMLLNLKFDFFSCFLLGFVCQ